MDCGSRCWNRLSSTHECVFQSLVALAHGIEQSSTAWRLTRTLQNFTNALLDPMPPSTISLLAMVRLNDALLTTLASSPGNSPTDTPHEPSPATAPSGLPPCPALEPHLLAVRMQLLPVFSKLMSAQIDSVRRINGSPPPASGGGVGGMLARATGAVTGTTVKDSVVKVVIGRYAELFNATVAMWSEEVAAAGLDEDAEEAARKAKPVDGDDEMVFAGCVAICRSSFHRDLSACSAD